MKRKTIKNKNNKRKTRKQKGGNGLDVFYNTIKVAGQELPKDITQVQPTVKFPTTEKLYTLVMWDPDVPPQIQPGFVHWLVTNIENPNDIYKNQVLKYKGPSPPSGIHRYYFGLFELKYISKTEYETKGESIVTEKTNDAIKQLNEYIKSEELLSLPNLKRWAIVFVNDKCVKNIDL